MEKIKLLVIDDNINLVEMVKEYFKDNKNIEVVLSAYDGEEGIEVIQREKDNYDVIILNYANGDMVGHTGVFDAAKKAVEVMDECLGKVIKKVEELGGTLIVTADHGNCDYMLDENNNVVTSHSTSLVPFIVGRKDISLSDGKLGDIAPTILSLLGLEIPNEMTGKDLIKR